MRVRNKLLYNKLSGLILCLPLLACGSGDVNYVSRQNLNNDQLYQEGRSDMKLPTNYGAVKLQKLDDSENEGQLFVLQKAKKVYQFETMFKSDENKKYYFALGMNYKKKAPHVSFRVEF